MCIAHENHPLWVEIKNDFKERGCTLQAKYWIAGLMGYTTEQLYQLAEICPEINEHPGRIAEIIIQEYDKFIGKSDKFLIKGTVEQLISRLNDLVSIWGFEYQKYDCLSVCLGTYYTPVSIIKFFLEQGSSFESSHIKYLTNANSEVIELMLELSPNPDSIVEEYIKYTLANKSKELKILQIFSAHNFDLTSHFKSASVE
jgi:hypothetical protein